MPQPQQTPWWAASDDFSAPSTDSAPTSAPEPVRNPDPAPVRQVEVSSAGSVEAVPPPWEGGAGDRSARLVGHVARPEIELRFAFGATHPRTGKSLQEWVKSLDGRRWDPESKTWRITSTWPKDPVAILADAGFSFRLPEDASAFSSPTPLLSLDDLSTVMGRLAPGKQNIAQVLPRMRGWAATRDLLGDSARWDKENGWFEVSLSEIVTSTSQREGRDIPLPLWLTIHPSAEGRALIEAARGFTATANAVPVNLSGLEGQDLNRAIDAAAYAAISTGLDLTIPQQERIDTLAAVVGDFPDWFGMAPRPYQRLGAMAAAAGRGFLADNTGLGKSIQLIGAFALHNVRRGVIVVPPVVLTHWSREIQRCGLAAPRTVIRPTKKNPNPVQPPLDLPPGAPQRDLVVFKAGRKEPELPDTGVVVVADSLLASRPALVKKLIEWRPDAFGYDEAHRARNHTSARGLAAQEITDSMPPGSVRIVATATPLFNAPHELLPLLSMTGQLVPVFGSRKAFLEAYTRKNRFNALEPRVTELPRLREVLYERVWIKRKKAEVLTDLPPKDQNTMSLDVDLAGFRAAHNELMDTISVWISEFAAVDGVTPGPDAVEQYAKQAIGLMSPLRKAAGMAKVPAAIEMVAEWIDESVQVAADGTVTCDRPLILWAHHKEVVAALVEHAAEALPRREQRLVGVIDGSTSDAAKARLVDDFQAYRLPILICSITAAGVGLTLTASSDAVFVESDFSVPLMTQARDRIYRIGQERPVTVTSMVAVGTLDDRIQSILARKSDVIGEVTGEADFMGSHGSSEDDAPWKIIAGLVEQLLEKGDWAARAEKALAARAAS